MKRFSVLCWVWILIGGLKLPASENEIRHRFLAFDYWKKTLWYVDQFEPAKNWQMPWGGGIKDFQLIGNHQILVPEGNGWAIYDLLRREKIDSYQKPEFAGTTCVRRLRDGRTFVGANQKSADNQDSVVIFELGKQNKIVNQSRFDLRTLRLMRRTFEDRWLLGEFDGATEVSLAPDLRDQDRVLRRFKMPRPRNAYMALKQANGNVWVAGGYAGALFEYRADGTLIREFSATQPEGMHNRYYAGIQILKNHHIVQCNWNGHNEKDYRAGWNLIEFDTAGKVVWRWSEGPDKVGSLNAILVLDDLDLNLFHEDLNGIIQPNL
jgi:hypothetical protein